MDVKMVTEKKRGGWLTFWLVLMLIGNTFSALGNLFGAKLIAILTSVPLEVIYSLGVFSVLNIVFTIFLFLWKKWAFFAFCGVAVIAFVINLVVGTSVMLSVLGLFGPAILYLLMRSKWDLFE